MLKLEKLGADVWFDLEPGDEIRLRLGPALTWAGPKDALTVSPEKAIGAGLKNRALRIPLMESKILCNEPTQLLAKFGTKVEIWALELNDDSVFFKGAFYMGHKGDVQLTARNLNTSDLLFMIEPKGRGTIYLALPKNTVKFPVNGETISTPYDTIALMTGDPTFKNLKVKDELKDMFKKGFWARGTSSEISGLEELYIYGGSIKGLFSSSSDDDEV